METIIKNLQNENWDKIKKSITENEIQWDFLVDQTNGLLHYLAYHNKTDLIKLINTNTLKEIMHQPNIEGDTVCHIAAKMNNIELLGLVMSYFPEIIYEKNRLSCTPLNYLVTNKKLIKQIVKAVEIRDHHLNNNYTLIEYFLLDKNPVMVKYLLKYMTPDSIGTDVVSTLIRSENDNDTIIDILKILLTDGFDINKLDSQYLSPLIASVQQRKYPVTKFLLENGANPNYSGSENKQNPIVIAIYYGDIPVIELLINNGIDINTKDKYLQTPVHHLFSKKNELPLELKKVLLSKTKNINSVDNGMNSILNLLVHNDDWKLFSNILEKKKLKIYSKNKNGTKPIDAIPENELTDFFEMVYRSYINQLKPDIKWIDKVDQKISENNKIDEPYKKYIMNKIKNGQSCPLKKQNDMLKMIKAPETNITHYSAYSYNYICFLLYILKKYSNIKIPSLAPKQMGSHQNKKRLNMLYQELVPDYKNNEPDNDTFRSLIRDYINHSPILINHIIIWRSPEKYFISPYMISGVKKTIDKFPNIKFILFKLTIISNSNLNHANILIFDVQKNYIERFDPYGKVFFYDSGSIDQHLKNFFVENFPNIGYISPNDTMKSISFQIFSDETNINNYVENDPVGFCIPWCLWYIEMRIKNYKISPDSLINRAIYQINKNEIKFKDYIRNYSNYLDYEKNIILKESSVPERNWYTMNLPEKYYFSYLRYIRKQYRLLCN